ncbi:MAG: MFS transporter [Nitrososphaerales archaeon]
MQSVFDQVDRAKWTRSHSSVFVSLAMGFFIWGVIGSLAPLFYPSQDVVWILILPYSAQVAGDLVLPRLSDVKLGRKPIFFITLFLTGAGSILIAASLFFLNENLAVLALGLVLAYVGVEGEVPNGLSYASEIFPLRFREKMLVLIPNFDNFGAMVAAAIGFVTFSLTDSVTISLEVLALLAMAVVAVAFIVRYSMPESVRWLAYQGKTEKAQNEVKKMALSESTSEVSASPNTKKLGLGPRLGLLVAIGISQYLTYGLMTYIIADYYFTGNAVNFIVMVANAGAFVAGFITILIIGRMKVKAFSLFAFWGGALTMIPLLFVAYSLGGNLTLFYVLLFVNVAFSEFAWAVRGILEPVLMPSKNRAFLIGCIRLGPMLSYIASVYYFNVNSLPLTQFVEYNLALWILGGVASVYWFVKGYNIERVDLEEASSSQLVKSA